MSEEASTPSVAALGPAKTEETPQEETPPQEQAVEQQPEQEEQKNGKFSYKNIFQSIFKNMAILHVF